MKNLTLAIMLLAIGMAIPPEVSAKIDAATLDRQRAANKARLSKSLGRQRLFNKASNHDARQLKLDAIPPSPRRGARSTATKSDQTLPGNPRRASTGTERRQEPDTATQE
ncbi:MAG: hypothetical protein PHP70_08560 [Gallionella sp.]|nr:hypothetical protein [Gallionella sp.]